MRRVHLFTPFWLTTTLALALTVAYSPTATAKICASGREGDNCGDDDREGMTALIGGIGAPGAGLGIGISPGMIPELGKKLREVNDHLNPRKPNCTPETPEPSMPEVKSKPELERFMKSQSNKNGKVYEKNAPLFETAAKSFELPLPLLACTLTRGGVVSGDELAKNPTGLAQLPGAVTAPTPDGGTGLRLPAGAPAGHAIPVSPERAKALAPSPSAAAPATDTLADLRATLADEIAARDTGNSSDHYRVQGALRQLQSEIEVATAARATLNGKKTDETNRAKNSLKDKALEDELTRIEQTYGESIKAADVKIADLGKLKNKGDKELERIASVEKELKKPSNSQATTSATTAPTPGRPASAASITAGATPKRDPKTTPEAPPSNWESSFYPNLAKWKSYFTTAQSSGIKDLPGKRLSEVNFAKGDLAKSKFFQVGYGAMNLNRLMEEQARTIKSELGTTPNLRSDPGLEALTTIAMKHLLGDEGYRKTIPGAGGDPAKDQIPIFSEWMEKLKQSDQKSYQLAHDVHECMAAPGHGLDQSSTRPATGEQDGSRPPSPASPATGATPAGGGKPKLVTNPATPGNAPAASKPEPLKRQKNDLDNTAEPTEAKRES